MPRLRLITRDEMLYQCGAMPCSVPAKTWEHRKSAAASELAKEHNLTKYASGSRAIQYDQAEVDKVREKTVQRIAA